ncbi:hypothetical protein BJ085DRAFT_22918, partial [Dimargaris cristalligena]
MADGQSWTFSEANQRANRLAWYLRWAQGVTLGTNVGVFCDNSPEGVTLLVAISKAGGVYVVVDSKSPAERMRYIFTDSDCSLILTTAALALYLPSDLSQTVVLIDQYVDRCIPLTRPYPNLPPQGRAEDLVYVLYTSGTTGQPKGVMVTRANVTHFAMTAQSHLPLAAGLRLLQSFSLSFDAAGYAVYLALCRGSTAVFPGSDLVAAAAQCDLIVATPTFLSRLDLDQLPRLRYIICGAEPFPDSLLAQLAAHAELFNLYGPTETTIAVTGSRLAVGKPISIGRPFSGTHAYIVDAQDRLVPIGVVGDLWIGGPTVTAGYVNRLEQTAAKFRPNPFGPGRVYQTGDRARWLPSGEIEYLGRRDNQIKLGGFRIELEEIETALHKYPSVERCLTLMRDNRLVAYVQPLTVDLPQLKQHLRQQLPHYMVPAEYILLERFEVNTNGKIDRTRLPS